MLRSLAIAAVVAVLLLGSAAVGHAQDTNDTLFYLGFRLGVAALVKKETAPGIHMDRPEQLTGMYAGFNINRFLGVELTIDRFETDIHLSDKRKIGEYGLIALIPHVRLRYPVLNGRLVPYALAGVGVTENEFNDRKEPGIGMHVKARDTEVVGSFGVGVEYFVAKNIAFGGDVRYMISRGHEITVGDHTQELMLDSLFIAGGIRLIFPDPDTASRPAVDPGDKRTLYIGVRAGGAAPLHSEIATGLEAQPQYVSIGDLDPLLSVDIGMNFTKYLGAELSFEGYSPILAVPGLGKIGEYGLYMVIPQLRVRYPLWDGRFVPYGLLGIGVGFAEFKDRKPHGAGMDIHANDFAPIGGLGVGFDYFVAHNIAIGLETKYIYSRDHEFKLNGRTQNVNLDSIFTSAGVRIFFFD
jgi:opacity protein-like surface antigen